MRIKRNIAEVTLGPESGDKWGPGVTDPNGSTTWTATEDGATVTITFQDEQPPQVHGSCKAGSIIRESPSGSIHVEVQEAA